MLWFVALLETQSLGIYLIAMTGGILASVWFCGRAERILQQTDPPSVVLDEVIAVPLCFVAWLSLQSNGHLPGVEYFFGRETWMATAGIFVCFRIFDITKPWPVHQSQSLSGGWGVTVDDVLAAVYVNLVVLLVQGVTRFF